MTRQMRAAVAPFYLFACLLLGGSAQGIWQNMLLQLGGLAILAWAAADAGGEPMTLPARQLLGITAIGIAVVALQLVPLSADLWSHFGARAALVRDYRTLGIPPPALPVSLDPHSSLNSLLGVIPALAIYCAIARLRAYRASWLAVALLAGTFAGILLGALQVASANSLNSAWYIYDETNWGVGVGFFANANHMATLLVVTIPFLAAIAGSARQENLQRYSAVLALVAGAGLVVLVGLALNGSLAGYGLALPVLAASVLILLRPGNPLRMWVVAAAALSLVAAIAALATTSIAGARFGQDAATSVQSRETILATTTEALKDFMPFGTGLGTFRSVYRLYEQPEEVTATYVVHAHDDYVELALEMGVAGVALMLLFLGWWAGAVWRVWRTAEAGPFTRAATIASAAILVHSLVDFPLRTVAISAFFAVCLALMSDRGAPRAAESSELRPARHLVFM